MRQAVLEAPGRIRVERAELPEPAGDEVRVRIEGCGVCASSLPVWEGRSWFDYPQEPGAPGHEGWGVIDAVGEEVRDLSVGDPVAILSEHAFSTHDLVRAERTVRLPDALGDRPFPGEPLGCAMNIFRRSAIERGQTVAIVGVGFLGALLTQLAKEAGARVIGLSRRETSLEMAERCGADEVIRLGDGEKVAERVEDLTGGALCERVIEATGKQNPLTLAGELTGVRGRLVIAGYHQDGPREVDMQLWNWRGIDVINAHEREEAAYTRGMREAVRAVETGRLDPSPLFTHRFPLEELDQALEAARTRPDGFMKALVMMEDQA